MSEETPDISPVLKTGTSKRNLQSARKAVTVAQFHAWDLVGSYMGSDTLSRWRCLLPECPHRVTEGKPWEGEKFYSHIRGRTDKQGNWRPFSKTRHPGCLPFEEWSEAFKGYREANGLQAPQ